MEKRPSKVVNNPFFIFGRTRSSEVSLVPPTRNSRSQLFWQRRSQISFISRRLCRTFSKKMRKSLIFQIWNFNYF